MTDDSNDQQGRPNRFSPSEAWIDAFQEQATHALRLKAKRFARSRARLVARAGGRVDEFYVSELVQDVLTDTLFGVLTWNPDTTPLERHVFAAIRSRSHHDSVRAKRFRSLDAHDPGAGTSTVMAEIETSLSLERFTPSPVSLAFSDEVLGQMRKLAREDRHVIRILDAIALGATDRQEIMLLAKMSTKNYHKAHIRLGRLVERLSQDVVSGLRSRA